MYIYIYIYIEICSGEGGLAALGVGNRTSELNSFGALSKARIRFRVSLAQSMVHGGLLFFVTSLFVIFSPPASDTLE